MDTQILAAEVRSGFQSIREAMQIDRALNSERHEENREIAKDIQSQVRETNGRVTRHDEQIRTLFERVKERARQIVAHDGEGEDRHVTLRDVGIWVAIVGGAVVATVWFLIEVLHWGPKP